MINISKMRYSLFITSSYKQLSAVNIKNHKIKTSFVNPEGPKALAKKNCFNLMIFILIFVENYLGTTNDFSVWLRTGSNPADINRFRSRSGNNITYTYTFQIYIYYYITLD